MMTSIRAFFFNAARKEMTKRCTMIEAPNKYRLFSSQITPPEKIVHSDDLKQSSALNKTIQEMKARILESAGKPGKHCKSEKFAEISKRLELAFRKDEEKCLPGGFGQP